jgi:hypothetical protein
MEEPQLRERLLRRNAAEVYAFKPLIESHTRAQATAKSLSARNTVLERYVVPLSVPCITHHAQPGAGADGCTRHCCWLFASRSSLPVSPKP